MRYLSLLILLGTVATHLALAQAPANDGEFWIGGQMGFPLGLLKDSLEQKIAPGGAFGFVINPSKSNDYFQVGAELGLFHFGKQKTAVNDIRLKSRTTIFTYHLVGRVRMQTHSVVRPYADVLIGGKAFITAMSNNKNIFESVFGSDEDEIKSQKTFTAFSYGGALGVTLFNSGTAKADFRVSYLAGSKTRYVYHKDMTYDPGSGEISYPVRQLKRTDMIFPQINLLIPLGKVKDEIDL